MARTSLLLACGALAKEVANRNITVNTVTPGYIDTDTVKVLAHYPLVVLWLGTFWKS